MSFYDLLVIPFKRNTLLGSLQQAGHLQLLCPEMVPNKQILEYKVVILYYLSNHMSITRRRETRVPCGCKRCYLSQDQQLRFHLVACTEVQDQRSNTLLVRKHEGMIQTLFFNLPAASFNSIFHKREFPVLAVSFHVRLYYLHSSL